jgi:hypothetical protein
MSLKSFVRIHCYLALRLVIKQTFLRTVHFGLKWEGPVNQPALFIWPTYRDGVTEAAIQLSELFSRRLIRFPFLSRFLCPWKIPVNEFPKFFHLSWTALVSHYAYRATLAWAFAEVTCWRATLSVLTSHITLKNGTLATPPRSDDTHPWHVDVIPDMRQTDGPRLDRWHNRMRVPSYRTAEDCWGFWLLNSLVLRTATYGLWTPYPIIPMHTASQPLRRRVRAEKVYST